MKKENYKIITDFAKKIKFSLLRVEADPFFKEEVLTTFDNIFKKVSADKVLSLLKHPSENKLNEVFAIINLDLSNPNFLNLYSFFLEMLSIEKDVEDIDAALISSFE